MRDILDREICLNDLVIFNDKYYLVTAEDSLYYSDGLDGYPKFINNISSNVLVVKVTNYDEKESKLKEILESTYMSYIQNKLRKNSENINIGDVFKEGMSNYIYLGMVNQKSSWFDENNIKNFKEEKLYSFYYIGDFCEAKNKIFEHKCLDIDFLLQYTAPRFKNCKDLNRFLNKVVLLDSVYVTNNSFNDRHFQSLATKKGRQVRVDYELNFDFKC